MWLVGAGEIAQEYAKVLLTLDRSFEVVGRGQRSASMFSKALKKKVHVGGIGAALKTFEAPDQAIVAVGIEELASTAKLLLEAGTKRILLEKPGGVNLAEIKDLQKIAAQKKAEVFVAYNRRFFGSVVKAREIIKADGGVRSAAFEITEWSHIIKKLPLSSSIKQMWFVANTSHVVDLVFHFIGPPKNWSHFVDDPVDWHQTGSRFAGAGVSQKGAFFNYFGDWQASGRWGVEIMTKKSRLIFRPMEELSVVSIGSVEAAPVVLDNHPDVLFKPGFLLQTKAFIEDNPEHLCTINEQILNMSIYADMAGYSWNA